MPGMQPPLTAEERAQSLLIHLLGVHEWWRLHTRGYVDIQSPSVRHRFYRIPRDRGMIDVWENDKLTGRLCVGPSVWARLPDEDVVAVHLLMLQANETEYLLIANRFPAR